MKAILVSILSTRGVGYLAAVLGIGVVIAIGAPFHDQLRDTTVALALLLVVLFIATLWGRGPGIVTALLGMLCFKFFFLPPLYTFTIADPQNWVALAAFIITASTVGHLSVTANRRAAEAEARRREARLVSAYNRSLIEASLDPLVTIGSDGRITDVNVATERATGHSRMALIGTDFSDYFTEPERGRAGYQQVFREGFVRDYPLDLRHRDGHISSVLYNASVYRDDGGKVAGVVAVARDITERKRAEEALRVSEANLNRAQEIAHLGSWHLDVIHNRLTWSDEVFRIFGIPQGTALTYEAFLAAVHPEDRESVEKAWAAALRGTPYDIEHRIVIGGEVNWVRERAKVEFDEDGNALEGIGTVQDITERKRAEAQLRRINRANRALSRCNQVLIRATDESTLLQQVCELIVEEAGYRLCWVGRAEDDEAKSVRPLAQAGFEEGYLNTLHITWADTERGRGPTGTCIRTRQTVLSMHIATDPKMSPWREEALKRGYASNVAIPLMVDSAVFGAITIYASESEAFGPEEVQLLTELADDLAFGITTLRTRFERAKGEVALREKEERVRLLLDSTAEAICGLDLQGNCTWVNQACVHILGYADSSDLLGKNLHSVTHHSRPDGTPLPQDQCPTHRALTQGDYVHVDNEIMWRANGTCFPVEYWSHPVRRDGELIGAVVTFLDISERKRAEEEIRILNAERADTEKREAAHKREIEIGFEIQQTLLLDHQSMDVPGLRAAALTIPSQQIDGDFYYFYQHENQCLDLIVADVMGKGIPAALLGAATKSHFLEALCHLMALSKNGKLPEPKEIVTLAHGEMVQHLINLESFVTLCYARLDVNKRHLDLVDCGHTGIIHWLTRTGECKMIHGDNLPLGVRAGEIYDQIAVPFEPGDVLFFYSDGVTEARNAAGELFGAERLAKCVQIHSHLEPQALVEAIRIAVLAFSEPGRLSDDLTCLAIKVEDRQLPLVRTDIEIPSALTELRRAREFVRTVCRDLPGKPLDADSVAALELAVNEAASNIIKHAYHGRADQWIYLEAEAFPGHVSIRLHHLGDAFDPSTAAPPALDGSRESGFGIYLITRSVDDVRYYRDERGRNCIALVKIRT